MTISYATYRLDADMELVSFGNTSIVLNSPNATEIAILKVTMLNPYNFTIFMNPIHYIPAIYHDSINLCDDSADSVDCMGGNNDVIIPSERSILIQPFSNYSFFVEIPEFNDVKGDDRLGTWKFELKLVLSPPLMCLDQNGDVLHDCNFDSNVVVDPLISKVERFQQVTEEKRDIIPAGLFDNVWIVGVGTAVLAALIIYHIFGIGKNGGSTSFKPSNIEFSQSNQNPVINLAGDNNIVNLGSMLGKIDNVPKAIKHTILPSQAVINTTTHQSTISRLCDDILSKHNEYGIKVLLEKAITIAALSNDAKNSEWLSKELMGYTEKIDSNFPSYRFITTRLAVLIKSNDGKVLDFRDYPFEFPIGTGVRDLDHLEEYQDDARGVFSFHFPVPDYLKSQFKKIIPDFDENSAPYLVKPSELKKFFDGLRTRILDYVRSVYKEISSET